MALARRAGQRRDVSGAIWPGFVDAMTALLLVLMFVLSIFMIVQFVLRDTISAQDTQLEGLTAEVASLVDALGLSRARVASLEGQVGALAAERDENRALIAAQLSQLSTLGRDLAAREAELGAAEARITDFEAQVAALIAARDTALAEGAGLRAELAQAAEAEAELLSQQEALQLALAAMRRDLDGEAEALRLEALRAQALEAALAEALANATAQGAEAEALRGQLAEAEAALSAEERRRLSDAAAAEALRRRLETADTELTAMTLALEEQRRRAEETLTLLAAARAGQAELEAALEMEISERDRIAALRAMAERDLAASTAQSLADQRMLEVLNQQVAALRGQVGGLQELLGAARAREDAAQTQIETLGADLNMALAQLAVEQRARADLEAAERERLERFQSEFFGRLREVLEGREEIQIVGDRFLFSSEVLFELGSAELAPAGRAQIGNVVQILREVADEIPPEIDWILRVDGHTDNLPLGPGADWPDNWALSQARALSVVRYMTEALGFPPQRLAATGFGEYRPVDPANTPEARARNRRIELKLTER